MPSAIGKIRGDLLDAQDCIKKDVHNYEEKQRKKIEQRKKACEERRAEQLMILTIGTCEELDATRRDLDEEEKMTSDGEKEHEMTLEKGGQAEVKQSGRSKKGKTDEESETSRSEKETPFVKEKRAPRRGAKINTSKHKKKSKQKADESAELHDSIGKEKRAYEEEEIKRLKEELYQEGRKREYLVNECIRLERQNEKLIIKNNHLKRKQQGSSAHRGKYAPKRIVEPSCKNSFNLCDALNEKSKFMRTILEDLRVGGEKILIKLKQDIQKVRENDVNEDEDVTTHGILEKGKRNVTCDEGVESDSKREACGFTL
ncbi:stress response protein nst1-like [Papaver somniferum]|uniref:stress response protein nst1-like n=1 Tax=Papaver somniferum TaxID=3469 RepID=UPI000E6FD6AE|nr:stress response protein nst1-like [Papaver somniferum]